MHRIDSSTATAENQFTEGSVTGGIPATIVTAAWLNDIQEELLNVLTGAGIAPVKGQQDQLLSSLLALFLGTGEMSTNGYVRVPFKRSSTGARAVATICWGVSPVIASGANQVISLPAAFVSVAGRAWTSYENFLADTAVGNVYIGQVRGLSLSQITIRNLGPANAQFAYLAIGE